MSTSFQKKYRRDKNPGKGKTKHVRFANETDKCVSSGTTVDELEQNRESLKKPQHLRVIQSGDFTLGLPTPQLFGDVLASGDFTIYQGGDLNEFFGAPTVEPQRVSEVCLVNDHYILVKMPDTCWRRRNSQIECIAEEVHTAQDSQKPTDDREDIGDRDDCRGRKFSKYFQCNRSSRVSPIQERMSEHNTAEESRTKSKFAVNTCWNSRGSEKEVYQTITKIQRSLSRTEAAAAPHVEIITREPPLELHKRMHDIQLKPENTAEQTSAQTVDSIVDSWLGPVLGAPDQTDFEIKRSTLQTSVHDVVHLEQHGALKASSVALQNSVIEERHSASEATAAAAASPPMQAKRAPKSRRRFVAFRWLLKPFRARASKGMAPKSKIHAVIYKTYFVRWKRPPETMWHGYGLRPENSELKDKPKLRRCRSAIF